MTQKSSRQYGYHAGRHNVVSVNNYCCGNPLSTDQVRVEFETYPDGMGYHPAIHRFTVVLDEPEATCLRDAINGWLTDRVNEKMENAAIGLGMKPDKAAEAFRSPPQRDDEACGIGGKPEGRPRKYEDDHASLSATLRKMRACCAEGNVPLVLDWDGFIKHAEELEEKAKECDSLSQNLWVANDHAISLAKQRDGLAKLCEEMIGTYVALPSRGEFISVLRGGDMIDWRCKVKETAQCT